MAAAAGLGAVAVLALSLAAKMYMSFAIRANQRQSESTDDTLATKAANASKAQLNVAEYEALFITMLLFFYLQGLDGLSVLIVSVVVPIAQAVYFWGRVLSGKFMPWAPLGALPRYICMGISIYILYTTVGVSEYGPGQAALLTVINSLAAKLYMSFGVRVKSATASVEGPKAENASKAQLNVKEYETLFTAIFLFLFANKVDGLLVTIVSIWVPIAQAIYFWGRTISGQMMPWAPIGALSRYACMCISIHILYTTVDASEYGPGLSAVVVLVLSLAAKMYMSFAIRVQKKDGEDKAINASKAQLNVAEYEDLFMAILLFMYESGSGGISPMVVSIVVPIAQAVYFWGRTLSGGFMPWAPLGALPRYICMAMSIYILYGIVG